MIAKMNGRRVLIPIVAFSAVLVAEPVSSQIRSLSRTEDCCVYIAQITLQEPQANPATQGQIYVGGILGGLIGLGIGIAGGIAIERGLSESCSDLCGLAGAIFGGTVGESFGMALGSHWSNDSRGPLALTTMASLGIAAAGWYLASRVDAERAGGAIVLAVPVTQLLVLGAMELRAQRKQEEL